MHFLAFGFHYSEQRPDSQRPGVTNSAHILRHLMEILGGTWTLVTREPHKKPELVSHPQTLNVVDLTGLEKTVTALDVGGRNHLVWEDPAFVSGILRQAQRDWSKFSVFFHPRGDLQVSNFIYEAHQRVNYWSKMLDRFSPQGIVFSNVPHLVDDFVLYHVARKRGLPTIFPYRFPIIPRICSRLYVPRTIEDHQILLTPQGRVDLRTPPPPSRLDAVPEDLRMAMAHFSGHAPNEKVSRPGDSTATHARTCKFGINRWSQATLLAKKLLRRLQVMRLRDARRKRRLMVMRLRDARRHKPSIQSGLAKETNYVYFPLHMQPEASSDPLGGFFADQLYLASTIASSLPSDWLLVVKEHPLQNAANRSVGFHQALREIPKTVWAPLSMTSAELIEGSRAVATISGTVAAESTHRGTPAVVFGGTVLGSLPGAIRVENPNLLPHVWETLSIGSPADFEAFYSNFGQASVAGRLEPYVDPDFESPMAMDHDVAAFLAGIMEHELAANQPSPHCEAKN